MSNDINENRVNRDIERGVDTGVTKWLTEEQLLNGEVRVRDDPLSDLGSNSKFDYTYDKLIEEIIDSEEDYVPKSTPLNEGLDSVIGEIREEFNVNLAKISGAMVLRGHNMLSGRLSRQYEELKKERSSLRREDRYFVQADSDEKADLIDEMPKDNDNTITYYVTLPDYRMLDSHAEVFGLTTGCYARHCMYVPALETKTSTAFDKDWKRALDGLETYINRARYSQIFGKPRWDVKTEER